MVKPAHHKQKAEPIVLDVAKAVRTAERNRLAIHALLVVVEAISQSDPELYKRYKFMIDKVDELTKD